MSDVVWAVSSAAAVLAGLAVLAAWLPARIAGAVRAAEAERLGAVERGQERLDRLLREELARSREELSRSRDAASAGAHQLRQEVRATLEELRKTVDGRLERVQQESAARLEQVRATVDEKLQGTLEKRLGESFRLVSERLEAVQRGLGEMQTLATGVGDLRKVLANVKVRGTWGEVQLGALLEQMLSPGQFARNVATRPGNERVEYVVRLPGHDPEAGEVLLPIDAKFPIEDYQRLVEASERGDAAAVEEAARALEVRIKGCARDVHDKYLNPPATTDFALLFLPTEGLYAEVVRRPGLPELLQREFKVVVSGPTTLAALLSSLQLGFRTLAIQQRSSEVWQVLGAVKTEFAKFGGVIEKVEKKLEDASKTLATVGTRSRAIERRLRGVEQLPEHEVEALLVAPALEAIEEDAGA
ncbi:MAG TPA: DNA recombination protein RmuC [Anaeromyxobacteraceae bacterium]|nr:DNA recombination protein RmuC [Anaeromyxobacteraceae bacterium]